MAAELPVRLTSLEEIRDRLADTRAMKFETGLNAAAGHFDTPVERELYHLAGRCWNRMQALVLDLDLYVGLEPTLAEEAAYRASEWDRLHGIEDRVRLLLAEFEQGMVPDQVSRQQIITRLITVIGDKPDEVAAVGYPPAFPWAALMDDEDLADFLVDLGDATVPSATSNDLRAVLAAVEAACSTHRLIAEAQHAHNTAPGPDGGA